MFRRIRPRLSQRLLGAAAPDSVSGAVVRFALTGLLVMCLVGVGAGEVLRRVGINEAVRDSAALTRLAGEGIVAPAVTPALLRGQPEAIAAMDRVIAQRVRRPPVVRVKLWDATGRIVYSDEPRLVGRRYRVSPGERAALEHGETSVRITDLTGPEHRLERGPSRLMEVYSPIAGPDGTRLVFETYQKYAAVTSSARDRWLTLLPVLLGALGLLAVLQIPLAATMARRLKRAERDRVALLERAIDAQQQERRRIASDLHDGVVQSLAGISYQLAAAREHAGPETPGPISEALRSAARETRRSMRALRSLLVDIYPPSLEREGLAAALSDLQSRTAGPSLDVRIEAPDIRLPARTEALLFRAAQEALRNVIAHAQAQHVDVSVQRHDGHVALVVEDDGRGFTPAAAAGLIPREHFGLRALEDLVRESGGTLHIETAPESGTRLSVDVPVP